jgi:hypothetical protein
MYREYIMICDFEVKVKIHRFSNSIKRMLQVVTMHTSNQQGEEGEAGGHEFKISLGYTFELAISGSHQ